MAPLGQSGTTPHSQFRLLIVSSHSSSSVPTPPRQRPPLIVSADSSSSAPTPHRQRRLLIVSADSSSSAPTLHRQRRLSIVSSDPSSSRLRRIATSAWRAVPTDCVSSDFLCPFEPELHVVEPEAEARDGVD